MGTVYLALDLRHARNVAIKVLPPDLAQAVGTERFLREIAISARLTHPHILSVHDSGHAAGLLYYVMPFVAGESLRQRIDRVGSIPPDLACRIAADLASALAYAHELGIVHRDLKPENVLLAGDHAFLADFGVAATLGSDDRLTESGGAVGTRRYASPEQAAGGRALDARTDIYSLGCVLYEMLAGPTASADALEGRLAEPLPPVAASRTDVPVWIDDVISRATARRAEDRFENAGALRAAILAGGTGASVGLRSPWRLSSRSRWMVAATLIALGSAITFSMRRSAVAPLGRDRVLVAGFTNRTGDSALAPLGEIADDYIARGLAATHLVREVFDARTLALEGRHQPAVGAAAGRQLATKLGVGTVLWGSYFLEGGRLHFESQLVDTRSGKVVLALEPVVGDPKDDTQLIELLRQRVMAGFAITLSPTFESWRAAAIPPTYEAYQEMLAGDAATWVFNFPEALRHFRRAATLDTSFTSAQTSAVVQLWLLRDCRAVDSAARHLAVRAPTLPPVDRQQLAYSVAACRKDSESALAAARAVLDIAPRSAGWAVLGAIQALAANRPRAALELLQQFDPERAEITGEPLVVYRDWVAMAYHALGDHAGELSTARTGLRIAPTAVHLKVDEASALAALGRRAEAEQLASSWVRDRTPGEPLSAEETECVALELRAHGDSLRARRLLDRAAAWYGPSGAIAAARDDTMPCLWDRFSVHYYLGDLEAAQRAYTDRLMRDTSSIKAHGALAAIAAHAGDLAAVRSVDDWLAKRQDPLATVARARVAAILGDRNQAVSLLRQAIEQGLNDSLYLLYIHLDPDFESLRDVASYHELLRPKG